MAEEKLFVRKATGLVREIGAITAIIIVMANTIGLGWQKRVFQYTGRAPLPENQYLAGIPPMTMAFILGGIAILLSVLAVSVLSSAMPRSGGGYVVISRIIGPVWGFLGAWLEFLSIAWSFGIIAVAVFEGIFQIMGPIAFGPFPLGANAFGSNITDVTLFAGGLVLVLVFTVIGIFGVRLTGLLLQAMFWVPSILTFYVFGLLSQANPTTVAQGMTNVLGHTPVDYVNGALSQGLDAAGSSAGGYWGAVFTAMVGAYFAYICCGGNQGSKQIPPANARDRIRLDNSFVREHLYHCRGLDQGSRISDRRWEQLLSAVGLELPIIWKWRRPCKGRLA